MPKNWCQPSWQEVRSRKWGVRYVIRRWKFSSQRSYPSSQIVNQLRLIELEENLGIICSNPSFQIRKMKKLTEVSFQSQMQSEHSHSMETWFVGCQFHNIVLLTSLKIRTTCGDSPLFPSIWATGLNLDTLCGGMNFFCFLQKLLNSIIQFPKPGQMWPPSLRNCENFKERMRDSKDKTC